MSTSQNGWKVVTKSKCDQGPFAGVTFPNGILAGDVAVIARWQLARYEADVETLKGGTCWGWYDRAIRGSTTISNHASATAWDCNADRHPLGSNPADNFSAKQIAACRKIISDAGGVLRWGGDYSGRKDPMHWEINTNAAKVKAFADKIRAGNAPGQEDDVTPQDKQDIINGVVAALTKTTALDGADGKPDGTTQTAIGKAAFNQGIPDGRDAGGKRQTAWQVLQHLGIDLRALSAKVDAIQKKLGA